MADSQPFVSLDNVSSFSFLHSWKVAAAQMLALVIYGILVLIFSVEDLWIFKRCDVILFIFYCQAALWILFLIVDHYYKWQHHRLYLKGHFEIYNQFTKCCSLLFAVLSLFNAAFLVYAGSVFYQFKSLHNVCDDDALMIPTISANIIVGLEIVILNSILLCYVVKVIRFNRDQPVADVGRVSFWAPENSSTVLEVGYRDMEEDLVNLLQKQADLIQYYKGKIAFLNDKIIKLSHSPTDC